MIFEMLIEVLYSIDHNSYCKMEKNYWEWNVIFILFLNWTYYFFNLLFVANICIPVSNSVVCGLEKHFMRNYSEQILNLKSKLKRITAAVFWPSAQQPSQLVTHSPRSCSELLVHICGRFPRALWPGHTLWTSVCLSSPLPVLDNIFLHPLC